MYNNFFGGDFPNMTAFWISYFISITASMAVAALIMVASWHLFKKLGMPGWKGLIPFYSDYMLFKTVWRTKPFWVLVISGGVYCLVTMISTVIFIVSLAVSSSRGSYNIVPAIVIFAAFFGLLTLAIAVISIVIGIKLNIRLAKTFGKGVGFALGLTFITPVFYLILAFGKAQRVS